MKPIIIRLGGYQPPASIHNCAATWFGERLKAALGERVEFELIGDVLRLGYGSGDLPHMVASGRLTMCYISTVRFAQAVPELKVLELPFVVSDRTSLFRALDRELGERFRHRMHATTPFRLLAFWDNGFRHLTNKVHPIRRPQDCRGIRIRTQMSALHGEALRALGFEPIAADIKEFVEKIGTDYFQAQDNPLTNIYNFGVHRYHRYITLTGHFFGASAMICNAAHYASWPIDVQNAVHEAAREATDYQRRLAAAEDHAILAKLDPADNDVIRLTASERAEFAAAVEPVIAKYRGGLDPELFMLMK